MGTAPRHWDCSAEACLEEENAWENKGWEEMQHLSGLLKTQLIIVPFLLWFNG